MRPVPDDRDSGPGPAAVEATPDEWAERVTRVLALVPSRLQPPLTWLTRRGPVRLVARATSGVIRVQLFDRAMTLAAQAFTSIFPVLILLGSVLGTGPGHELAEAAGLPETSRRVLNDAFGHGGFSAFGVLGGLIVLVSSTGLARALARAYAAVWDLGRAPSGPRASWRWLVTVLALAAFMVGSRLLGGVTGKLPMPHLSGAALLLLADIGVVVLIPRLLLSNAVAVRLLMAGGFIFGLVMLVVRPVGSVYLPRALATSADRYGTIGAAFTYIGWLYIVAFCVLLSAILGQVLTVDEGPAGRLLRGRNHASGMSPPEGRGRSMAP
uniref:YhjD/YihY/BrkB family envelope integrity protein n=1 Tax=Paractinoplanes polyasparticus TaxID=2856853 RepID=UPI001C864491|nr:YhjD/YihY/BrkB family envelope integrity protein [Actinoplanes polyasparticus]